MDFVYIFAIIIGSVFLLAVIIASIVVHGINKKTKLERVSLIASYQSDNAKGMDYSESAYEEFFSFSDQATKEETSQISIFDIVKSSVADSDTHDIIENDGLEEIKGNFEG